MALASSLRHCTASFLLHFSTWGKESSTRHMQLSSQFSAFSLLSGPEMGRDSQVQGQISPSTS